MNSFIESIESYGIEIFGWSWPIIWNLVKIVAIVLPIMGLVAYSTLYERKLIGWMHVRLGPNRVGPLGIFQPIADALKLLSKEIVIPSNANSGLYLLAPVMTIMPSLAAWAVIPFGPQVIL